METQTQTPPAHTPIPETQTRAVTGAVTSVPVQPPGQGIPPSTVPAGQTGIPPHTGSGNGSQVPPPPAPRITMPILIAIVVTVIMSVLVFLALSKMKPQQEQVVPTPTMAPIVTPTPVRQPSAIASQSAFIDFRTAIATLSAAVATYNVQDPSLTPPTLVLPLGFSR